MKPRGIVFNQEEVLNGLSGRLKVVIRKMRTRRPLAKTLHDKNGRPCTVFCPWRNGQELWVKETWAAAGEVGDEVEYRADNHDPKDGKWRSAMHMPHHLSRLSYVVTCIEITKFTTNDQDQEWYWRISVSPVFPSQREKICQIKLK